MNTTNTFKSLSGVAVVFASTVSAICSLTVLPASAVSFTGTGAGFSIPDGDTTGASSTITVPTSSNFLITDITVTLNNLTHIWIGDLIATLTYVPTNTTVTLFNRIGQVFGPSDSNNFGGNYSFNDAFTGNIWTVAGSGDGSFVIPSGNYFPTGAGSSTFVPMLTSLGGSQTAGGRLTISDNGGGDTGALGSWTLNLQGTPLAPVSVPESSSGLGLLALGLLGAGAALKRHLN
ncbi:MAG: proprotein convertase P-domain, (modular protein) [Microcystis panniformis Mp_MB_F_20051200_S9]|uniref:Proprotein convertase P-domain, (Modular protein) n=1 Tax=Microcystis panniformis Mp_MB_F_20051200_S9 TaxID=2486223 RepID=A0A552QAG0_9CHRO|nr:MAG: proprotein convertase P-domain, (modular protein) [Microcystis panniformis Mp_GB_SS_20050300_S99]TRV53248.1 MAG: proprotein convertase P-domain, (modular protein) [Microcystis panniformis Mp_MB_F_20080800_S26D]TRV54582.1 MAG: proprotein convertase P-domain, (modular protein) [Microcystis panniformis Mp_GB_SS_20050300_S99D]TRV61267.1 MAG: proprotein convertase P-domain, (modular protein) [Microcystis panniformis Mp_MB_F_20080800_S26]TRV66179.1 MAG: proprotein convertase P-domain, (modula